MNYISQLNGFWRWRQLNIISPKAMLLYFAIMNYANMSGWQEHFTVPSDCLIAITGLGKNELSICRKELVEHKLIYYERGYRGRPAHYRLFLLYSDEKKAEGNTPVFGTNSENSIINSTIFGNNLTNKIDISTVFGTNSENSTGNTPVFGTNSGYVVTTLDLDIYKQNNNYIYINNIYNTDFAFTTDILPGSKAVGHACSYDDLSLTAGGPGDEEKGSTTDGPAGSVNRCVNCFTSAIHPFFSVKEAEMINALICEFGEKAFIGAVKYAQSKGIKHKNTWKWLQTVLDNGDWKKGYDENTENQKKTKHVSQIPVITPDEIFDR